MRETSKSVLRLLALVAISPVLAWHWVLVLTIGRDRAVEDTSQWVALLPGLVGQYLRRALLSCTLEACDPTCVIGFGTVFSRAGTTVGARAYVGPYCTIGLVQIQDDALIAAGVHIPSGPRTHGVGGSGAIRDQAPELRCVSIGRGAWIGNNSVVMADVGDNSVIGAGSVVTRQIPPSVVAAGVPAQVLRPRSAETAAP